jgi:subtilisin family serine protease
VIGITVCAAIAALGFATAGFGGIKAWSLATRKPTPAELTTAGEIGAAQRWEREPAADMFPASFKYTTDLQTSESARRLAIGSGRDCAAAIDSTLRRLASQDGCAAGVRATYADALGGTVYTVGVLVFPDAADATAFYKQVPIDPFPATGLHALPVAGTVAARFSDAARQALAAQQAGAYVVLAVAGYADGRPASASNERRDAVFDPANDLVTAVAGPLAEPVTVRCGNAEWTCLAGSVTGTTGRGDPADAVGTGTVAGRAGSGVPTPPPFQQIRPFEMAMLNQVGVPAAWQDSEGRGVTVAVLDTGVNTDAPDLTGVVTTGPDYTAGADPAGYRPPHEHGTYIATIIAGRGSGPGHSQGIVGVAPESKILSVRVILDDDEPGFEAYNTKSRYADAIGRGIYYAVAHGAKVINMSLGSGQPTGYLRTAVGYAIRKGVVVVASAGNNGSSSGFAPYLYPASFSGVIAVAAATSGGTRASFSEQNASVVLAAPGVGVVGDISDTEFLDGDGTSPAAAVVSGVAALIKSRYPALTPALVEQAMIEAVTHRPDGGYDVDTGFGEINAADALAAAGRLAAAHPARGLPASARFAAAPGPIQVIHRDTTAVTAYGAVGGAGLVVAIAALSVLVVLARRRPAHQPAAAMPNPSLWTPEPWTAETWRHDDPPPPGPQTPRWP